MSELYTKYATEQYVDDNLNIGLATKADAEHSHDSSYDVKGAANTALNSAKEYADTITAGLATEEYVDTSLENKLSSTNPTGTGSLSLNRKSSTTVGTNSVAVGTDTTASAASSFAEGQNTTASGANSHAEGIQSSATAYAAHAEGAGTTADGVNSHAEGNETFASGESSHAEGLGTIAIGDYQHTQGKYNISDESYAHIVGNGTGIYTPSNAHTLDWDGNANFAGDVYVGNANENKAGKKLATEEYVDSAIANGSGSVQPDWNQTDETASDFIKNKPFGEGGDSKSTLITSGIVTIENYQGIVNTDSSFLEQEIPYYVIFNNIYRPVTYHNNDNYCGIGNASLYASDGYDSGEFIFICAESSTSLGFYVIQDFEDDNYEFEIWADVPTIKTVDEKYLPVISIEKGGTGQTSIVDTAYTTARYRASSLHSTETTPTTNGVITWTYE